MKNFKNAMDIQFGMLETWLDGQFPSEEEIDEAIEKRRKRKVGGV